MGNIPFQYLHQSTYGHVGGTHTMRPMFVRRGGEIVDGKMVGGHIYKSEYHPDVVSNKPGCHQAQYVVRGDKIYGAGNSEHAGNPHALFSINGDKIHTTVHNENHVQGRHVFEMGMIKNQDFIDKVISNA